MFFVFIALCWDLFLLPSYYAYRYGNKFSSPQRLNQICWRCSSESSSPKHSHLPTSPGLYHQIEIFPQSNLSWSGLNFMYLFCKHFFKLISWFFCFSLCLWLFQPNVIVVPNFKHCQWQCSLSTFCCQFDKALEMNLPIGQVIAFRLFSFLPFTQVWESVNLCLILLHLSVKYKFFSLLCFIEMLIKIALPVLC